VAQIFNDDVPRLPVSCGKDVGVQSCVYEAILNSWTRLTKRLDDLLEVFTAFLLQMRPEAEWRPPVQPLFEAWDWMLQPTFR